MRDIAVAGSRSAQHVAQVVSHDFTNGILLMNVIYSLLITIIVLFETVTVYFRTIVGHF